jgi:hypothetical protein
MIDIANLLALRDGVATRAGDDLQRDTGPATAGPEQASASPPAVIGSTYPVKRLVLENGSYRVADHGE